MLWALVMLYSRRIGRSKQYRYREGRQNVTARKEIVGKRMGLELSFCSSKCGEIRLCFVASPTDDSMPFYKRRGVGRWESVTACTKSRCRVALSRLGKVSAIKMENIADSRASERKPKSGKDENMPRIFSGIRTFQCAFF